MPSRGREKSSHRNVVGVFVDVIRHAPLHNEKAPRLTMCRVLFRLNLSRVVCPSADRAPVRLMIVSAVASALLFRKRTSMTIKAVVSSPNDLSRASIRSRLVCSKRRRFVTVALQTQPRGRQICRQRLHARFHSPALTQQTTSC